ncbi:glycosyltransferase involved in cell wall biosynthesis [Brevundimonas alba]|uniref:Glycosyltransferase involved in cell wall biosynthesis n=1 Tax=Brevundimonas alba TaxID=74314 RepID=A0A7X6BMY0_9CAUL|nr:glycosyltransferase family 4 protein [Brevundimonas alba]NJC40354.1 glycosyltransferase involved in cell wall biosynthesis [Brevundimonas alba]
MTAIQPRRVLMNTDAVGGVWTYALDLSAGLIARGIEVTLAVLGPAPQPGQRRAAERIAGLTVVETGLPLDWTAGDAGAVAAAAHGVARLATAQGADLVHLNTPALTAEGRFRAPVVGACHSCLASWWSTVKGEEPMPEPFRWRTDLLTRGYAACDRLIAPSYSFMQETAALYGVLPQAVRNGRTPPTRVPAARRNPVVMTSGRLWDEGKNFRTLDRAAGRMRGQVHAAGSLKGPDGQTVAFDHILCLNQLDAPVLAAHLERSAVFASLSLYEPFGLGVLEAAQAGCALVLSDIPTFRELWQGAAVFVPAEDDAAVAEALDGLLDDPERAEELGRCAAERSARFTVDAMIEGTLAVYGEALAARAPFPEVAA